MEDGRRCITSHRHYEYQSARSDTHQIHSQPLFSRDLLIIFLPLEFLFYIAWKPGTHQLASPFPVPSSRTPMRIPIEMGRRIMYLNLLYVHPTHQKSALGNIASHAHEQRLYSKLQ